MAARRTADLPLHAGAAPAWLFRRMVEMAGAIGTLIVRDGGPIELLRRLSDPFWFQAFGCVLGFDWHSSGVTTTVCGALKEAGKRHGNDLGIVVCGGKGATSRKTPDDIRRACERTGDPAEMLVYASRMAAKVDSAAVQDGYQLYHHAFLFAPGHGAWSVVQQGMNTNARYARRYHWLSETMPSYVVEPHAAVACDQRAEVLNLVAGEGERHRQSLTALSREHPDRVLREVRSLFDDPSPSLFAEPLAGKKGSDLHLPARHSLTAADLQPASLKKVLLKTYETQATNFEQLLGETGIGAAALRSLSLLAEVIYNAPASRRDPAVYSFAHGGKDGHPYRVNRLLYDANLDCLRKTIDAARIGQTDKVASLQALARFTAKLDAPAVPLRPARPAVPRGTRR
jgi:hypothetical protein